MHLNCAPIVFRCNLCDYTAQYHSLSNDDMIELVRQVVYHLMHRHKLDPEEAEVYDIMKLADKARYAP